MAPVIKVSSRTTLSQRWFDLIDLDAGTIATGDATIKEVGEDLFHKNSRCGQRKDKNGR